MKVLLICKEDNGSKVQFKVSLPTYVKCTTDFMHYCMLQTSQQIVDKLRLLYSFLNHSIIHSQKISHGSGGLFLSDV